MNRRGLASETFTATVSRAIVIDAPDAYQFVRQEDLVRWALSFDEVASIARANLEAASRDVEIEENVGRTTILTVASREGRNP